MCQAIALMILLKKTMLLSKNIIKRTIKNIEIYFNYISINL